MRGGVSARPPPPMVHAARAYLTQHHATGVDAVLWEIMDHPLPDRHAIDAVNTASQRAQTGTGGQLNRADRRVAL